MSFLTILANSMKNRPLAVTFICWFIIIACVVSVLSLTFILTNSAKLKEISAKDPYFTLQMTLAYATLVINFICGIAMLKGKNWARILFTVVGIANFTAGFYMGGSFSWGMVAFALFVILLFLPNANRFFTGSPEKAV